MMVTKILAHLSNIQTIFVEIVSWRNNFFFLNQREHR